GDDTFQFDVASRAWIELAHGDNMPNRAVAMDDSVFMAERRLVTDGDCERLLEGRPVVRMNAAFENLKRYRVYAEIDVEHTIAFARRSRKQRPCVPPVAAHAAELLALDHPHIGLAERLEKLR